MEVEGKERDEAKFLLQEFEHDHMSNDRYVMCTTKRDTQMTRVSDACMFVDSVTVMKIWTCMSRFS